jgi:hypothetical protein
MADDNPPPLRARRWTPPPSIAGRPPPRKSYRFVLRLLGIPIVAVIGVFIYSGIRNRIVLPDCDSDRAKKSLVEVLQQFKYEPTKFDPIKTVSATKDQVVCSAMLPLPDGSSVSADFTFYWEGDKASMKYSVARKAAEPKSQ